MTPTWMQARHDLARAEVRYVYATARLNLAHALCDAASSKDVWREIIREEKAAKNQAASDLERAEDAVDHADQEAMP